MYIIYVPGLGDHNPRSQKLAVRTWRLWGVKAELFQMNWADQNEPWQPKFDRLLARIDELTAAGENVALVGASAGASAVINAFAARKGLAGVVLIAGKVNHAETIGRHHERENPPFWTSGHAAPDALERLGKDERRRILSIFSIADPVVKKQDSYIPGATNRCTITLGHSPTIAAQITLGALGFIWWLKRKH